jgi:hypothetical protein
MTANKVKIIIDGIEHEVNSEIKIIATIEEWENEDANFNPHPVEVHLTVTHEGIVTDLVTDAYNSNPEDTTFNIVESKYIEWIDYVICLEP